MGISWMFQYEACRRIGVSTTSLLYCVGPILVVVLAQLLFHERMSAGKLLCLLAVSAGAILTGTGQNGGGHSATGVLCALLCAAACAGMILFNKRCSTLHGLASASLQLSAAFLPSLFWNFLCRIAGTLPPLTLPHGQLLPVLVLGLLNTGLGCFLYFSGIAYLPAQSVAVCDYLEPLTAVILAALVLRESLSPLQIAGAALILIGTACWGICQKKKSPTTAASHTGDPGCADPLQEHSR